MKRLKRLALRLGLVAGVLLLVVGLVEIGFRFAGYGPDEHLRWRAHPDLHYTAAPNQDGTVEASDPNAGETTIRVHINQHGQRCEDYGLEKEPGEIRIVGLGDSLTFGPGVGNDDLFLTQAQQILRDDPSIEGKVRLVNAAANGYSTVHYLRWMETQIDVYHPDVVVMCLYIGNDMTISRRNTMFNPVPFPGLLRNTAVGHYLLKNHRRPITRLYVSMYGESEPLLEEIHPGLRRYIDVPESKLGYDDKMKLWRHSLTHVEGMKALADEHGVPLVCLLIPQSAMVSKDGDFPIHGWLHRSIESRGLPVISPADALRPLGLDGWHSYDPGHLNPLGHRAVGEALADGLRELGFVR